MIYHTFGTISSGVALVAVCAGWVGWWLSVEVDAEDVGEVSDWVSLLLVSIVIVSVETSVRLFNLSFAANAAA